MKDGSGFIKLHRKITGWEWYHDTNTFRLFLHILLMANFTDGRFEGKVIKRGQLVTSLPSLSKQTGLSIRNVRTALDHLLLTGELTAERQPKYRIITVVNYDQYQSDDRLTDRQTTGNRQASDSQPTGNRQQYKNNKNAIREEYKNSPSEREETAKRFSTPTPDDIRSFCQEAGLQVDADRFCDYYASRGWKVGSSPMKDWRAAVRNWARRDAGQAPAPAQVKRNSAGDYEQRDYSGIQQQAMDRTEQRIMERLCKQNGLWDYDLNAPVNGWRETLNEMGVT